MQNGEQKSSGWGRPRDFVPFVICITIIGTAAAMHWRALDIAFALAWLGFLVVGSLVVLWRNWKYRAKQGPVILGQAAVLPRSWRRWVFGEGNDRSR